MTLNASDILLLVILLALSAYFSSSETAFSTVNKIRLKSYADSGSEKAKTALDIAEDYDRTLATILVGNNAVNTASAALMTTVASALFGASGAVIATFVTTVLLLIFGEILPKTYGKAKNERVALDNLFSQISEGEMKELPIIVKADVQGSVEAVKQSLEKISNDEVRVKVIHGAVGAVSESDVMLANASNAIIVGFNVRPDPVAKEMAERDDVEIRLYRVIYDAINEVTDAMKGMLAPKYRDVDLGRAEVRQVYKISSVGTVAGCYVLDGKITRSAKIRVVRDGIVVAEDEMSSLRRFKDDVREVAKGYECGVTLEKFADIKEGDIFEAYTVEEYRD